MVVACCITERADTLSSLQKSVSDLQIVQLIIMHYALMWHSTLVKAAFSVRQLVEHMAKYNKKTCFIALGVDTRLITEDAASLVTVYY